MKIYKIQDKTTGLYSSGGLYPIWSKVGKAWTTIGHLRGHLGMLLEYTSKIYMKIYENAEVVELETIENWKIPVDQFIKNGTDIKS